MAGSLKVGTTTSDLVDIPVDPDSITWGLQDISAADAGRVQDNSNTMYKMRTSQKRKLQLAWSNISFANASAILQMFNPEYVYVRYKDPLSTNNHGWMTKQFYVGDRSAPFRKIAITDANGKKTEMSTLSFDIIER